MSILIFLNHLNFQIIKINSLYEIILSESRLTVPLEIRNGLIQPDRLSQIKFIAYLFQGAEYLMGAGIITAIYNTGISQHMIVLENPCP